jgi:hypothetical protein
MLPALPLHSYVLTAQWINTNLSAPTTYIVDTQDILLLTGDPTTFGRLFGSCNLDTLAFVCTSEDGCPLEGSGGPEPSSAPMARGFDPNEYRLGNEFPLT